MILDSLKSKLISVSKKLTAKRIITKRIWSDVYENLPAISGGEYTKVCKVEGTIADTYAGGTVQYDCLDANGNKFQPNILFCYGWKSGYSGKLNACVFHGIDQCNFICDFGTVKGSENEITLEATWAGDGYIGSNPVANANGFAFTWTKDGVGMNINYVIIAMKGGSKVINLS